MWNQAVSSSTANQKQTDCNFIWCMWIKDYFPQFCVARVFHYVKSCFGRYSGNIRTSVLVSLSLWILLFQSELEPGSTSLCQVLLCSSQHYFNFIPFILSLTLWKMRIKTQWVRMVQCIQRPSVCLAASIQFLMRWIHSQASNAEHLMCCSFEETAKWSSLVITPQVL